MNVVIDCLVAYDPLIAFTFTQTCTHYRRVYSKHTAIIRRFRRAYACGVLRNFIHNFITPGHDVTNFVGNFVRLPPDTTSVALYNYNGHVEIVVNNSTVSLSLKYSICRHLVIHKLLNIIGEVRINYLSMAFYNKVCGHIRRLT
jgi:hypothetical protein